MKITGIEIGEYRQFKNIKFDFTYPSDHPKAGQPLNKVCFIGQSGTGKTTLLNTIEEYFKSIDRGFSIQNHIDEKKRDGHPLHRDDWNGIDYNYIVRTRIRSLINGKNIEFDRYDKTTVIERGNDLLKWLSENNIIKFLQEDQIRCFYIKDSIAREADAFLFDQKNQPQVFSDFVKTDTQIEREKLSREERINEAGLKRSVSLGDMQSLSTWQYLLREINTYDELTVREITKIVQSTPQSKVTEELQKWIAADPRIELAEKCLNPILRKFFLEVNIGAKGNVPITLQTKQGVKIDSSYLSTGTRQILATSIPLYKFDTKDTVILFDEPERSLFPDVQRELINHYTSLAPEAQFFFATHSPIIASAFEPCERFILYFNENGEVKCRNGVAPEGDDPNDVLRQDFGMSPLMLDEGVKQYQKYLDLATQIKNETNIDRKMKLIADRSLLGNKYNFSIMNSDETN